MFKTNYKTTLKAILRSPVSFLALCATIILTIAMHDDGTTGIKPEVSTLLQEIMNHVSTTGINLFPCFVGIMISANILLESRNGFGDLLLCSRKSLASIYLSKLCAIATASLAAGVIFLGAKLIWFWGIKYPAEYVAREVTLPFGEILGRYLMAILMFLPFMLLCFIAMSVFVSVITNVSAAGAVWNVTFYLAQFLFFKFRLSNFNLPPNGMIIHFGSFNEIAIDDPSFKALLVNYFTDEHVAPGFFGWIAVSIVLLMVSYFILKKRYRT